MGTRSHVLRIVALLLMLPAALIARPYTSYQNYQGIKLSDEANLEEQIKHLLTDAKANSDDDLDDPEVYAMKQIADLLQRSGKTTTQVEEPGVSLLFEGDIATTKKEIDEVYGETASEDADVQKVYSNEKKRWPGALIPYELDSDVTEIAKQRILDAMKEYEEKTCLRFKEATSGNRIHITRKKHGCWSYVGRLANGRAQTVSIGKNCLHQKIILHELGHAIGFWHEHSRPDRDRYITIHKENVQDGKLGNFAVRKSADYQGEVYDYASIMHYRARTFSKNKEDTISISDDILHQLEDKPLLGQAKTLSLIDAKQVNKMYNCYQPSSSPGDLKVKILQAGPFQDPGHYYACVEATDSKDNSRNQCTQPDPMSTTDPSWDEEFTFEQIDPDAVWQNFEITIKREIPNTRDPTLVHRQTIWVESKDYSGEFCATKGLCVPYHYKLEERSLA